MNAIDGQRLTSEKVDSDRVSEVRSKVFSWNMDRLVKYLIKKGLDEDYVKAAVDEYRRFLAVCASFPNSQHAVSPKIDEVWHCHILFTRDYEALAVSLGTKVHHNPFVDDADWENHASRYEQFRDRYKLIFGTSPSINFWPHNNSVGPCDCSNQDCHGYSVTEGLR